MEITPIGLRVLEKQEYSHELTSGSYYSLASPGPCQHAESEAFVREMQQQAAHGGVEVLTADPFIEGQIVCWRSVCPEVYQLIRIIGMVSRCESTGIHGWNKVTVKPRLYHRHDLAAAERMAGTPKMEFSFPTFRLAGY